MIEIPFDLSKIKQECVWFAVIYGAVTVSMILDFVAGVHKARKRNEATTSKGYKRSVDKAGKYFLPLQCCTCYDIVLLPISTFPFFTALMGLYLIRCEFKSIMENTRTKKELRDAENTMKVIIKNKDDIRAVVSETLNSLNMPSDEDRAKDD